MSALVYEIDRAKKREQATTFETSEAAIASSLQLPSRRALTDEDNARLRVFMQWCAGANVRYCPAAPTTIAAYLLALHDLGTRFGSIMSQLAAIETLHEWHGMANPVATMPVRTILLGLAGLSASAAATVPPRSWSNEERALFAMLPGEIQQVIARREMDREKTICRVFNERHELLKQLKTKEETNVD